MGVRRRLACLLGPLSLLALQAQGNEEHFEQWRRSLGRVYKSEEERLERYEHWLRSYMHVQKHKESNESKFYSLGLNEFSDWSPEERRRRLGLRVQGMEERLQSQYRPLIYTGREEGAPPLEVDWRVASKNPKNLVGVTKVKNQDTCGACWSFATVAGVEGTVAADQGILNELSNQQMIDCDDPPNKGCEGGDIQYALQYVMANALVANADYPFRDRQNPTCEAGEYEDASKIQNYLEVLSCDEAVLMKAVSHRPVIVAIDAYCDDFQMYQGGVLTKGCSNPSVSCSQQVDHAVVVVSYGHDDKTGLDYWVIKNSWGTSWGDHGYAYIQRNAAGFKCGVSCVSYYAFMPQGGVAFVNGTVYADDDYEHGSADDEVLPWDKIEQIAGAALVVALLFLVGMATGRLLFYCRSKCRRGPRDQRDGPLREPLLNIESA